MEFLKGEFMMLISKIKVAKYMYQKRKCQLSVLNMNFEHKKGKRQLYHDFNYQIKKQNNSMYSSVDLICELLKTMHYAFILP